MLPRREFIKSCSKTCQRSQPRVAYKPLSQKALSLTTRTILLISSKTRSRNFRHTWSIRQRTCFPIAKLSKQRIFWPGLSTPTRSRPRGSMRPKWPRLNTYKTSLKIMPKTYVHHQVHLNNKTLPAVAWSGIQQTNVWNVASSGPTRLWIRRSTMSSSDQL